MHSKRVSSHELSADLLRVDADPPTENLSGDDQKELTGSLLKGHKGSWKGFLWLLIHGNLPWVLIIASIAVSIFATHVGSRFPAYQARFFQGDLAEETIKTGIFILVVSFVLGRISAFLTGYTSSFVSKRLRNRVFSHSVRLPLKDYRKLPPRELISRITQDVDDLATTLSTVLLVIFGSLYGIVLYLMLAYEISPRMTQMLLATLPVFLLLKFIMGRINFNLNYRARFRFASLTRYIVSILMNIPIVQSFGREAFESKRGEKALHAYTRLKFALEAAGISFDLIDQIFSTLNDILCILVGAYLINAGEIDFGDWFAYYSYAIGIYAQIQIVVNLWPVLKSGQGSLQRIEDVLQLKVETSPATTRSYTSAAQPASPAKCVQHDLVCQDLSFSYEDNAENVLQHVSLTFPAGSKTALVGPSGAGKSTLLLVLEGLEFAQHGTLSFGDANPKSSTWRDNFASLQQHVALLGSNVRENLCYGVSSLPSDEALWKSLEAVGLAEHFKETGGLDSPIDASGQTLSGGELRRFGVARLLLSQAPVLLLDEPAANLDTLHETKLNDALDQLGSQKTIISVTHNLQTASRYERIVVLDNGHVVDSGNHNELFKRCDLYKKLYLQEANDLKGGGCHE